MFSLSIFPPSHPRVAFISKIFDMLLSHMVLVLASVMVAQAADPMLRKHSSENLEKARAVVENIKSKLASQNFLKEDTTESSDSWLDLPTWAYWAIGGGVVLLAVVSYVIYRYMTWVPKKRTKVSSGNGGTSSEAESSRLLATSDSH